ncbi:hypothetical protein LTR09_012686 [Extremus antarcticus]|uniref:N-acetyltransferase domain-containing protein n=1 Tax=Extremus antarcticus TaxID=702011 RepID=A0AAJ0D9G3_9PEZI|nr:hypothetical protein LTR09_012686 [Extremus antarcticus]
MASFRLTHNSEDELLARILYNAFCSAWEVNWWQDLVSPLRKIASTPSPDEDLEPKESSRLEFYLAIIRFVRNIGGLVAAAIPPDSDQPAAVICWLPPNVRPTLSSLFWSGWLRAWSRFGVRGLYHFWQYEDSLSRLYARSLSPLGYRQCEGAFVQIIATDPAHAGNGYSAALLQWQIEQHKESLPHKPVFLDAAADYSQRVYERLGFAEIGREPLHINVDEDGFRATGDPSHKEKQNWEGRHIQRVLMLDLPSDPSSADRPPLKEWGLRVGMVQLL